LSKSQLIAFTLVLLAAGSATLAAPTADYPIKPIRIITAEPGGVNDITTRMIAQELTSSLHQQVVVDNRGGAGGAIAGETVAHALAPGLPTIAASGLPGYEAVSPIRDVCTSRNATGDYQSVESRSSHACSIVPTFESRS